MRCSGIGIALCLAAFPAISAPSSDIASLASALPAGWKLTTAQSSLVIEARTPVRVPGTYLTAPHTTNIYVPGADSDPLITLALRYRTEPRWSANKLAAARAANAPVYATLASLRLRYRIDELAVRDGRSIATTPAEQQRLDDYEREHRRIAMQLVRLPRCALDNLSLFDDPSTYKQLQLVVDPPIVMREAFAVVELFKRRCR
ncbi:MAG: hypothetical protein ABI867_35515 [Kofleriaceae bacterium]